MSTLAHLGIAYLLVSGAAILFIWCLCVVSKDSDDEAREEALARRQRQQECEARKHIYGNGGWRSR